MSRWTISALLETAAAYLRDKGSTSPRLDAELLLAETLGLERIHLYMEFDRPLVADEVGCFRALIARRAAHEPVAYILQRVHFRHLSLELTPAVLIPRPETEELVEAALGLLRRRPPWGGLPRQGDGPEATAPLTGAAPLIADVGTGSGAIALSIAQETGMRVLALDSSAAALDVAARNAAADANAVLRNTPAARDAATPRDATAEGTEAGAGLGRLDGLVEFREADLLSGVPDGSLHLVVSNPPYVTTADLAALAPDIRLYEPRAALDGGPDGLDVIRRLLPDAARALRPGGSVLLEIGVGQAEAVAGLARDAGFVLVDVHKDMSQKDRIVQATLPGAPVLALSDLGTCEVAALRGALAAGAIIGIPTDTVYGLAAKWDSTAGVRALFAAKGRAPEQPVAVVFPSVSSVLESLPDLDSRVAGVMQSLLPGPYTFVVSTAVPRPERVGTIDSLGVRVPGHLGLLGFLCVLDMPLAATSANRSGGADVTALSNVDPQVLAHCSVALPGSAAQEAVGVGPGSSSTVVDLRPLVRAEPPVVLREGAVAASDTLVRIAAVLRG